MNWSLKWWQRLVLPGREKSYSPFPVQEGTCRSLDILINERRGRDRKANLQIDSAPKSSPIHGQQSLSASSFNSGVLPYPSQCDMGTLLVLCSLISHSNHQSDWHVIHDQIHKFPLSRVKISLVKWRTQIAKWGTGSWRGILEYQDLICMWGRALAKVTNKSFENWPLNSDLLIIQQACLPPINRLVDKRELGSLKADLGVSGLTWNFSPIRSLPSASNTLFIVPFSLGLSLNS